MNDPVNVKLDFVLDKEFLASYVIKQSNTGKDAYTRTSTKEDIIKMVNFQNVAWDTSLRLYHFIEGTNMGKSPYSSFAELGKALDNYFDQLIKSPEFMVIYKMTEETIPLLKNEWDTNYSQCSTFIASLGIKLDKSYKILVIPPTYRGGYTHADNLEIYWSYRKNWENYNVVYLWHEILHSYFGKTDTEHAIIQLIAENELTHMLNGTKYPPFNGHKDLERLMDKINPEFQKFLTKPRKNIKEFVKAILEKFPE